MKNLSLKLDDKIYEETEKLTSRLKLPATDTLMKP